MGNNHKKEKGVSMGIQQKIDKVLEEYIKEMWHEINCPAHSNQMGKEEDCNCLYSFVIEKLPQSIRQVIKESFEETRVEEKPDLDLSPGFSITVEYRVGELRGHNQALSEQKQKQEEWLK